MLKDKVYIIGISPQGVSSLSQEARHIIRRTEILIGGKRLLGMFPASPAEKAEVTHNLQEISDLIKANLGRKRTVVLASGDPNFFGIAGFLIRELGKNAVEIVPNVSSMQLAFARIKESWDDAAFASVHARLPGELVNIVHLNPKVGIFTDSKNNPAEIAKLLRRNGIENRVAYICQDLGGIREKIIRTDLYHVADKEYSPLNIMILIKDQPELSQDNSIGQVLGIPEDRFQLRDPQKSLITKLDVRAVSLAKMNLTANSIIWDIGAGSGAVSIEAAALAGRGKVFAIEKNPEDIAVILENVRRFQRSNIEVIQAVAPEGLEELPSPSSVFIGGSGGQMGSVLHLVCRKLQPRGRIVLNLATLENLQLAYQGLAADDFAFETVLLNISRSRTVSDLTRLEALNPVFVISAWRWNEKDNL